MVGEKQGMLTMISFSHTKKENTYCVFQCDCGNKITRRAASVFMSNPVKPQNCGCVNDLTGKIFGRLTVLKYIRTTQERKNKIWECLCQCGNKIELNSNVMLQGNSLSCGCLRIDTLVERTKTHGDSNKKSQYHRLYSIWLNMRTRCNLRNKDKEMFKYWAGKGIMIDEQWKKYQAFKDWAVTNGYKDTLTINRINGNGNYEPNNCRWATMAEQNRNREQNILFKGETASDASRRLGGEVHLVQSRIKRGMNIEDAFTLAKKTNKKSNV